MRRGVGGRVCVCVDEVVDGTPDMVLPPAQRVLNWSFKMGPNWQAKLIKEAIALSHMTV